MRPTEKSKLQYTIVPRCAPSILLMDDGTLNAGLRPHYDPDFEVRPKRIHPVQALARCFYADLVCGLPAWISSRQLNASKSIGGDDSLQQMHSRSRNRSSIVNGGVFSDVSGVTDPTVVSTDFANSAARFTLPKRQVSRIDRPTLEGQDVAMPNFKDKRPSYIRVLLFAGVVAPDETLSPWWICWFGFRIAGALGIVALAVLIFRSLDVRLPCYVYHNKISNLENVLAVFVPGLLSNAYALFAYSWLPQKLNRVSRDVYAHMEFEEHRQSLVSDGTDVARLFKQEGHFAKISARNFVVALVVIGTVGSITVGILHMYAGMSDDDYCGSVDYTGFDHVEVAGAAFCACVSTTPVLGAILLVNSLDVSLSLKEVKVVTEAVKCRMLTREMYLRCRDNIEKRSHDSGFPIGVQAFLGLYCTLGLLVHTYSLDWGDDEDIEQFVLSLLLLGKDIVLLFCLCVQVMSVNDNADLIVAHLIAEPWGAPMSREEYTRMDLLALATTSAVHPNSAKSNRHYFTTPNIEPISFNLCGMRLTKWTVVLGMAIFSFSFVEFTLHSVVHEMLQERHHR